MEGRNQRLGSAGVERDSNDVPALGRWPLKQARLRLPNALRVFLLSISITSAALGHQHLYAQAVTSEEPPPSRSSQQTADVPQAPVPQPDALAKLPRATALPPATPAQKAVLESDLPQSRHGDIYTASGNAVLTYADHILRADNISYNHATDEVSADGHVRLSGGANDEDIQASHGTYNLKTQTGRFYEVTGSVGLSFAPAPKMPVQTATTASGFGSATGKAQGYRTENPFLFDGRILVKTGPASYVVYNGSVTSCLLPHPDWQLSSSKITVENGKAKAANSTFSLLGIPVLFFPYVTHPTNTDDRQSGLVIPVLGYSSASNNTGSKGLTIGDQVYLSLGRSQDLTVGMLYYSLRGFSENATYRVRGVADDFFTGHVSALQDRGFNTTYTTTNNKGVSTVHPLHVDQGGQDVTSAFRKQLSKNVRAVGDGEYLSSYIYREAFTENFNQAVSSDILSVVYVTMEKNGYTFDGRMDRYEGLKVVPINATPGEEEKIFHAPSIDFTGVDHSIAGTPLLWSITASGGGLKRVQPNFTSSVLGRIDVRPELTLPLSFQGWHIVSSVSLEETAYTQSRKQPYGPNAPPIELSTPVNRGSVEVNVDIRPAVIERTFTVPAHLRWLLGDEVRHTIEPDITYRNVHGVDNFLSLERFDDIDLISDTDELQYALTQHLYFHPKPAKIAKLRAGCPVKAVPVLQAAPPEEDPDVLDPDALATNDANGIPNASAIAPDQPTHTHSRRNDPCTPPPSQPRQQEWFSWELAQKHFFAQNFGGAVIVSRRNIFDTTLAFSGIAFLTEARSISPLKSRMRFRTSSHTDIAWDWDYDTGAQKFTSSNVFLDVREGRMFGGFSYALLNAPGRFHTEVIDTTTDEATGLTNSAVSQFSQMRFLLGYGTPTQPGISAAASAGIDLNLGSVQYITLQASYNWNCCGLSLEYRKYDLGTVRDEGAYRFNFTLANIGTAGNLRRAESLF